MCKHAVGRGTTLPGQFRVGPYGRNRVSQIREVIVHHRQMLRRDHGMQTRRVLVAVDLPAAGVHLVTYRINIEVRIG